MRRSAAGKGSLHISPVPPSMMQSPVEMRDGCPSPLCTEAATSRQRVTSNPARPGSDRPKGGSLLQLERPPCWI